MVVVEPAQPPPPRRRRLELVHIPKTGGTSLELAAAAAGIPWGYCHHQARFLDSYLPNPILRRSRHYKNNESSQSPLSSLYDCPNNNDKKNASSQPNHNYNKVMKRRGTCIPYHLPPCFFVRNDHQDDDDDDNNNNNPKKSYYYQAALFAVVRHPYDRLVSEFGYRHRHHQFVSHWYSSNNNTTETTTTEHDPLLQQQQQQQQALLLQQQKKKLNDWIRVTLGAYPTREPPELEASSSSSDSNVTTTTIAAVSGDTATTTTTTTTTQSSLGCPHSSSFPRQYFASDCHLIPQAHYIFPIQVTKTITTTTTTTITPQSSLETNHSRRRRRDVGGGASANTTTATTAVTISMRRNLPNATTTTTMAFSLAASHRLVDHVLFYDHLEEDLGRLWSAYNLTNLISWSARPPTTTTTTQTTNTAPSSRSFARPRLDASWIDHDNRRLIQQVYRDDFLAFGFQPY
ncbi:hypothetical protein ACA910_018988 [Epithemia clementina (nom. ined.)]